MNKYFPLLSNGVAGAAFHGSIQMGYGLEVEHVPTTIDGIAFLSSRFLPLGEVNKVSGLIIIFIDIHRDLNTGIYNHLKYWTR